jgi:hypothetical protein
VCKQYCLAAGATQGSIAYTQTVSCNAMTKYITTYLIAFFFLVSCQNQDDIKKTVPVMTNIQEEWLRYNFSSDIKTRTDSIKNEHSTTDAAVLYSNIGKYFSALQVFDQAYEPTPNQSVFFDSTNYDIVPAIDYIIKEAAKNQIIIINEAHHVSYHRFFTMLLLNKLSEQGFNYFGAETLSLWDSSLVKNNYPTLNTGYYTVEPQYGNLIRQALKTGFKVFAYEPNEQGDAMQREIGQAKNIQKILKKDPKAKIVIHCGYAHLLEGEVQGWGKAMAGRLTEYTGINPLTIDQVELTEHFEKKYENPYYNKFNYDKFIVPVNKGKMVGISFRLQDGPSDIFVYHPRTHLKYNRPHWLFEYYSPKFINNDITISFPVLVKAYISTENEKDAVPVDVIEMNSKADTIALALIPKTSYKILIENKQKQKQTLKFDIK